MKGLIILVGASLLWLTACAQEATGTEETSFTESSEMDGFSIERVSKEDFEGYLKHNPDAALVDVRTPNEYNQGKIGDAINVDFLATTFEEEIGKLDRDGLTLIYCRSGGRSAKALEKMKKLGFTNIRELEGGYLGW